MKNTEKLPVNEDIRLFANEQQYLNQEPNRAVFYINGKAVFLGDGGKYSFTELPGDEAEYFFFGAQMENEYLTPASLMEDGDKETLFNLQSMNRDLNPLGLFAVSEIKETENGKDVYYALIVNPEHSENSYFKIAVPDIQKLDANKARELLDYNEERNLLRPYCIQIEDGMMLVY